MAPTRRQVAVHEVLVRHAGNYVSAARELGISDTAVRVTERRYLEASGEKPLERREPIGAMVRRIPDRLDRIEEILAGIQTGIGFLTEQAAELAAEVEALNARAPVLLVERHATHRRQADGGVGGRREREGRG